MSEEWISTSIERWTLDRLKPHPENAAIFGAAETTEETAGNLLDAIEKHGICEPLLVKADGTVLAGHLRRACAERLGLADVPVRVCSPPTYLDEVTLLIRSNTDRRQLTRREIALAFKRLKELPRELGGAKASRGPQAFNNVVPARSGRYSTSRDEAAALLGVPRPTAEACEVVFTTPGVPEEVQAAVNDGSLGATTAADAIRKERRRQGGTIQSPERLLDLLEPKGSTRNDRVTEAADTYRQSFARLVNLRHELESVLTTTPLTTLVGQTEQEEYRGVLEDIVRRATTELRDDHLRRGKPLLRLIKGGRS